MKNTHGGKRNGSGRPKNTIERKQRRIHLTDLEYEQVKIFVNNLKKSVQVSK